jgi:hypothetical protein
VNERKPTRCIAFSVMPGLDPDIHDETQPNKTYGSLWLLNGLMDCRVKPGNDGGAGLTAPPASP